MLKQPPPTAPQRNVPAPSMGTGPVFTEWMDGFFSLCPVVFSAALCLISQYGYKTRFHLFFPGSVWCLWLQASMFQEFSESFFLLLSLGCLSASRWVSTITSVRGAYLVSLCACDCPSPSLFFSLTLCKLPVLTLRLSARCS